MGRPSDRPLDLADFHPDRRLRLVSKNRPSPVPYRLYRGGAKRQKHFSSGVALYMLTADAEPGAEIYSAATTRDQARIVFDDARKMAAMEPGFRQRYGVRVLATAFTRSSTAANSPRFVRRRITLDGLNIHFAVVDGCTHTKRGRCMTSSKPPPAPALSPDLEHHHRRQRPIRYLLRTAQLRHRPPQHRFASP